MGGNKAVEISQYPLLGRYHRQFRDYLSRSARLMIIGYSFSDAHINRTIIDAAKCRLSSTVDCQTRDEAVQARFERDRGYQGVSL
jgi:hypothetical protein